MHAAAAATAKTALQAHCRPCCLHRGLLCRCACGVVVCEGLELTAEAVADWQTRCQCHIGPLHATCRASHDMETRAVSITTTSASRTPDIESTRCSSAIPKNATQSICMAILPKLCAGACISCRLISLTGAPHRGSTASPLKKSTLGHAQLEMLRQPPRPAAMRICRAAVAPACCASGSGRLLNARQADGAGAQHHLEGGEHDAYDGGEAEEQHLQRE